MKELFLSYRSSDYVMADSVRRRLEKENVSVWMAPDDIPAGSSYGAQIPFAIENCKVFLLILSYNAQTSKWIPKEIDRAINNNKRIIPYMIEKTTLNKEFSFFLSDVQIKEAYENEEEVFCEVLKEIRAVIGESKPSYEEVIPSSEEFIKEPEKQEEEVQGPAEKERNGKKKKQKKQKKAANNSDQPSRKRKMKVLSACLILAVLIAFFSVIFSVWSTVYICGERLSVSDDEIFLTDAVIKRSDIEKLSRFMALRRITLTRCEFLTEDISAVPVEKLHTLAFIDCKISQAAFDSLDPAKAEALLELDISGCKDILEIKNYDELSDTLTTLKISYSGIKDISFLKGCKKTEYLFIDGLELASLAELDECIYLKSLSAENNSISDIDGLSNCTILKHCNLGGNKYISDISILGKSAQTLENLDISENSVSDISALSLCKNLRSLKINGNMIESLSPLAECEKLEDINASDNMLTSVDGLDGLTSLYFVDLSDNSIREISSPLIFKSVYGVLLLHNNGLERVVLSENSYGTLYLHGNKLSDYSFLETANTGTVCVDYIDGADVAPLKENASKVYFSSCPLDKQVSLEKELYEVYFSEPEVFPSMNVFVFSPAYHFAYKLIYITKGL